MTATAPQKACPLTSRQKSVLLWLAEYQLRHYCPPTLRELGRAFGVGHTNGPASMIRPLVRKGWLAQERGLARGARLAPWLLTMPPEQVLATIRTAEVVDRKQPTEPTR